MKLQTLVFLLAAPVALCQGTGKPDLLTALQSNPDTKGFGDLLQEFPDLITSLNHTKQYTVFAPSNDAVAAFRATLNSSGAIVGRNNHLNRRSIPSFAASIALLFTDRSNQANLNTQPTDLITNLTDPSYINISPASISASVTQNSSLTSSSASSTLSSISSTTATVSSTLSSAQPTTSSTQPTTSSPQSTLTTASIVQSPTSTSSSLPPPPPPPPNAGCPTLPQRKNIASRSLGRRQSSNTSTISVFSGFGDSAAASLTETPYSGGAIRTVDNFFTLFGDLPTTLAKTNGTAFSAALSQANMLSSLSTTPRITVFVPTDSALQGQTLDANTLKQYILFDTYATTTTIANGGLTSNAGENVNVTILADGTYSVNNVKIVGSNVMIKNGVVHYIDGVFPSLTFKAAAPTVKTTVLPVTAVILTILVSYMGMASF